MRNILLIILFTISIISVGQTIEREVISSNGNFYSNSAGQLSTTLGEIIISTVSSSINTLTQGFHQTQITVTNIKDHQTDFEMNVYPNPTSNFITIKVKELKEKTSFSIYTVEGKMILSNSLTLLETKLNVVTFAKGNYFLKITQDKKIIKTYKIIKQ
ncbi:MAG: T9SS type A sorting domain-containing protein [Flavobacteriales bacterium]|nr:T9SS type A sorting domain-containing protein [Flavobacteriales bacterium]